MKSSGLDHLSLPSRSTVPPPKRDTPNISALIVLLPYITLGTFYTSYTLLVSPSTAIIYLPVQRSFSGYYLMYRTIFVRFRPWLPLLCTVELFFALVVHDFFQVVLFFFVSVDFVIGDIYFRIGCLFLFFVHLFSCVYLSFFIFIFTHSLFSCVHSFLRVHFG